MYKFTVKTVKMISFKEFAEVIKFHRTKANLSQIALANLAGVGKTVVFDIEKGKETVQFRSILKVMDALNIRIYLDSPLMGSYKSYSNEKS